MHFLRYFIFFYAFLKIIYRINTPEIKYIDFSELLDFSFGIIVASEPT